MTPGSRAEDLRREAEAAERLAAMVSYAPDKARLMELARTLQERACEAARREAERRGGPGES